MLGLCVILLPARGLTSSSTMKILACLLNALEGLASFAVLGRRAVRTAGVAVDAGMTIFSGKGPVCRLKLDNWLGVGLEGVGVGAVTVKTEEEDVLVDAAGLGGGEERFAPTGPDFDRNIGAGTIIPPTEKPRYGLEGSKVVVRLAWGLAPTDVSPPLDECDS